MTPTEKAALALCNEVRRQQGLEPCEWEQIERRHQLDYQLQAQAVILDHYGAKQ